MIKISKGMVYLLVVVVFVIPVSAMNVETEEENEINQVYMYVNNPPGKPIVSGPNLGKAGVLYTYTVCSIDPDGDMIYYCICWGDGCNMSTCECFESGEECYISHAWETSGVYNIRVTAMDDHYCYGECSDPLRVTMPKTYDNPFHQFIERLFEWFISNIFNINI